MTLKRYTTVRQLGYSLTRNYRNQMMYIAYVLRPARKFRVFSIPKKSGGERRICAPNIALLKLQREVKTLIEADYTPKGYVHGFVSGRNRSIVSNARNHTQKRWVLNIDLENYFESIHFGRISGRLQAKPYEYSAEIAKFVAHIACYPSSRETLTGVVNTSILMPGGALSPLLSNIVTDKLDAELSRLCRELGCSYSRYADDISISSNRRRFPSKIARFDDPESQSSCVLAESFQEIIERNGFAINHSKTRLAGNAFRQDVTGLIVNEKVNVKRTFIRNVRSMLHDWETNGYDAASANHFTNKRPDRGRLPEYEATNFQWVVRGKLEFIRQVRGSTDQIFRRFAMRYNDLVNDENVIPLPLIETEEVLNASVWYLENDVDNGSVGTCFAIAENLFVTCAHCVGEGLKIYSPRLPNFSLDAEIISQDDNNDLAIIQVITPIPTATPEAILEIDENENIERVEPRAAVQTAGFPSNSSRHSLTIRPTEVTGRSKVTYGATPPVEDNVFELLSGTYEGMSGGPVLKDGKVIGVIVRGPNDDDRTQPFLAVKAVFLNALIQSTN